MPNLIKRKQPAILNAKGEPIKLTPAERYHAEWCQRMVNDRFGNMLGYEVPITTLTTLVKKVTEQKYFEISPADYLPVRVGEGAWSSSITTFRVFDVADQFETGIINTGGNSARLASADAGVDSLTIRVSNWAKECVWNIFDLELAVKSGNWDIVESKAAARKRNWDLGIQRIAFLGANGLNGPGGSCLGLLNQAGITTDTTTIPKSIRFMSPTELNTFAASVIEVYRNNCARTAWPTHFIIPESDYNGLAAMSSPTYPLKSILEILESTFRTITRNANFKILPLAYGDGAYSGFNYMQYVLLNYSAESLRMDVPVPYTATLQNSLENFNFQNVGYGQFTGVLAYRPAEILYFQHALGV